MKSKFELASVLAVICAGSFVIGLYYGGKLNHILENHVCAVGVPPTVKTQEEPQKEPQTAGITLEVPKVPVEPEKPVEKPVVLPEMPQKVVPKKEPVPTFFKHFRIEVDIFTKESQDTEYAKKQTKGLSGLVSTVPSVKGVKVISVKGCVVRDGKIVTFDLE